MGLRNRLQTNSPVVEDEVVVTSAPPVEAPKRVIPKVKVKKTALDSQHDYFELKEKIHIEYVDFQRPRPKLIQLIGEENQGCPSLVIGRSESGHSDLDLGSFQRSGDYWFANETTIIAKYLARRYNIGLPHP